MIEVGPGGTLPSNARRVGSVGALIFTPTQEEHQMNTLKTKNNELENRLHRLEQLIMNGEKL